MIRKATHADIPAILELIAAYPETLLPRSAQQYAELLDTTWVAEIDGQVVGSCVLEIYSPKIAELRSVVVHGKYRDLGLGREMSMAAVAEGERRNIREIVVVTSSPQYFAKLGFSDCLHEKYALFWNGKEKE